jgi:signal transduction histidine kinase
VKRNPAAVDGSEAARLLDQAQQQLRASPEELRTLARGLRPAMFTERGLEEARGELARRSPLPVRVTVAVPARPPDAVELTAYFIVAEGVQNAVRHAGAGAIEAAGIREGDTLRVYARDDGAGGADPTLGSGLRGLADRAAALGGTLQVRSEPGQGTTLAASLPCRSTGKVAR